jgi:hypothetical protein
MASADRCSRPAASRACSQLTQSTDAPAATGAWSPLAAIPFMAFLASCTPSGHVQRCACQPRRLFLGSTFARDIKQPIGSHRTHLFTQRGGLAAVVGEL